MKKEEILRLSRNERKDEGTQYVHSEGRTFGVLGMVGIVVILSIYYLYTRQPDYVYPLLSVMFGYLCFESFGVFKATKHNKQLVSVAIAAIFCVIFLTMTLV